MLWAGGIPAAILKGIMILQEVKGEGSLQEVAIGFCFCLLPGILLWAAGRLTGKIGEADGMVLMIMGMAVPAAQCLETAALSLFLIGLAALVFMVFRFAKRGTRLPYIPFLTIAFWIRYLAARF